MSKKIHSERMNRVVQHIEDNLNIEIDIKALSEIAFYSEFHFHRLFRSYVGESVYGYRKRLLLERSIKQLLYSSDTITEISFKCGYDNQSSFNKAFKRQFSYTPSQVRQQRVSISTTIIKPNTERTIEMKPEIKNIENIQVIGARETGSYAEAAPKAWGRIMKFAYSNKLMDKNVRSIGVTHDDPSVTESDNIRYDACLEFGADISDDEMVAMVFLLLLAGHETTTHVISGGIFSLLQNPEQREIMLQNENALHLGVEELLRYVSAVQFTKPRNVRQDIVVEGVQLKKGDIVMPMIVAANGDPDVIECPHALNVDRKPNKHLSFGAGPHFCLGHQLARIEIACAVKAIFEHYPNLQLAVPIENIKWRSRVGMRIIDTLPVKN